MSSGKPKPSDKAGVPARPTILPAESAAEFHQLRAELIQSWKPANKQELLLVDHIAFSHWRMLRGRAAEFGIFNLEIEGSKKRAGIAPEDHSRDWEALGVGLVVEEKGSFDSFFRYGASAERVFFRSTEQLRRLQADRLARETAGRGSTQPLHTQPKLVSRAAGAPCFGEVFAAASAASSTSFDGAHLDTPASTLVSENGIGSVAQNGLSTAAAQAQSLRTSGSALAPDTVGHLSQPVEETPLPEHEAATASMPPPSLVSKGASAPAGLSKPATATTLHHFPITGCENRPPAQKTSTVSLPGTSPPKA